MASRKLRADIPIFLRTGARTAVARLRSANSKPKFNLFPPIFPSQNAVAQLRSADSEPRFSLFFLAFPQTKVAWPVVNSDRIYQFSPGLVLGLQSHDHVLQIPSPNSICFLPFSLRLQSCDYSHATSHKLRPDIRIFPRTGARTAVARLHSANSELISNLFLPIFFSQNAVAQLRSANSKPKSVFFFLSFHLGLQPHHQSYVPIGYADFSPDLVLRLQSRDCVLPIPSPGKRWWIWLELMAVVQL